MKTGDEEKGAALVGQRFLFHENEATTESSESRFDATRFGFSSGLLPASIAWRNHEPLVDTRTGVSSASPCCGVSSEATRAAAIVFWKRNSINTAQCFVYAFDYRAVIKTCSGGSFWCVLHVEPIRSAPLRDNRRPLKTLTFKVIEFQSPLSGRQVSLFIDVLLQVFQVF